MVVLALAQAPVHDRARLRGTLVAHYHPLVRHAREQSGRLDPVGYGCSIPVSSVTRTHARQSQIKTTSEAHLFDYLYMFTKLNAQ